MQSEMVVLRATPSFVALLTEQAEREGLTKSEVIRRAVVREGAMQGQISEHTASFNPFSRLRAAATGSLDAQRELAREALRIAIADGDVQTLLDGLCFARLAAAHDHEEDAGHLLCMLVLASDMLSDPSDSHMRASVNGEAIALIAKLADNGLELADARLSAIVEKASPADVEASKYLHALMSEAQGE